MKKIILLFTLSFFILSSSFAQEEKERGFKKEQLFLGTGVNVGFFQGWILGLNPEVGYSLNNFLDAGVSVNLNYVTRNYSTLLVNNVYYDKAQVRFFSYGGGPFLRAWIVNQFFITSQFEFNQISESFRSQGATIYKTKYTAPSLLIGGGWGNRMIGKSQVYTSIMVDILRDKNSPYIDQSTGTLLPVFRTTFALYLKTRNQRR